MPSGATRLLASCAVSAHWSVRGGADRRRARRGPEGVAAGGLADQGGAVTATPADRAVHSTPSQTSTAHRASLTWPKAPIRLLAGVAVAGALAVAACSPPPPPPPPPVPTTTLPVRPACTVPAGSAHSAAIATAAPESPVAGQPRLPALTGSAEITTAANDAVQQAAQAGEDSVTVVAVDDHGRPSNIDVPLDQAVDVALATAERLDVVGVEAPSYAHALEASATTTTTAPLPGDPDVDKQWALASFPFSALWACSKGAGITIGVVDSGVQGDHPDLAGRVLGGAAIQNAAVTLNGGATDVNGHGTHVAGIIAAGENGVGIVGVAPEATILPVRVLDSTGSGLNSDIGDGIKWAVDHGANVINISIGSSTNSASVATAVDYAVQRGVTVVAAAGNNHQAATGADAPQYPAALDSTVAVAALSQSGAIASYSTNGAYVDVAAPGSNIWSTIPVSTWGSKSGTSMASPHVTALIALILGSRGSVAPAAMLSRLTSTAADAGPAGFDSMFGWGRIDPVAALDAP
jgi:subtilisin family serine protease